MRMRVHCRKKGKKKKHVISRYRTCDFLTWSQQLFWLDHANILPLIRARSPTDTGIQASKQASKQKFLHPTPSVGLAQAHPNYESAPKKKKCFVGQSAALFNQMHFCG